MTEAPEDPSRLEGAVIDGRYVIERFVARGGSGFVCRAHHLELASPVALKVLVVPEHLRGAEAAIVERFRQEARTLATLHHPAIVRALDVGSLDDGPAPSVGPCVWMALEWLDGVTLDEHLRDRAGAGRSPRETLTLLAPALDAIACAHEQGIAHRDLKPANLMVVPARRGGVALRVLDFGIAKAMLPDEAPGTGQTRTRSDYAAYSLPYAAPEQVGRLRTGPWTDVHALGLLVTEVLTGRAPYGAEDAFTLYAAVMAPQRPSPARFGVDVGPWEATLAKALSLNPGDRFADAGELHAALEATVEGAQRAWERARTTSPDVPRRAVVWASVFAVLSLVLSAWGLTRPPRAAPPSASTPAAPPPAAPREVSPLALAAHVDASAPTTDTPTRPPVVPAVSARPVAPAPPRAAHPPPRTRAASTADVAVSDPDDIMME